MRKTPLSGTQPTKGEFIMKASDIFDEDPSKVYASTHGQRICFSLSSVCRRYHYDKTLGLTLGIYLDHVDPIRLHEELALTPERGEDTYLCEDTRGPQLIACFQAYNFDTGMYEQLLDGKAAHLPLEDKQYFRVHPVILPCHVNESGGVRIRVEYCFVEASIVPYGFLGRKLKKEIHCLAPEEGELVTVLTAESGARRYDNRDEGGDAGWMEFER